MPIRRGATGAEPGLRQSTISGIMWTASSQLVRESLRFIIAVALARLVAPEDFGLVGMVTVFTGFANLFREMGFGSAIIQKQDIEERHLSSIFWLNIIAGISLTGIVGGCAPLLASFYAKPILIPLTLAVSLNFTIGSFNVVHNALMNKNLEFRRLSIIRIGSMLTAGVVAVAMALAGFGVWSLVANSVIAGIVQVVIMWHLSYWRPRFLWNLEAIRELFGFSFNLLGFRIFNYWTNNIDNLLIGKFFTAAVLGIYDRAFGLMRLPVQQIFAVLTSVMFPAFSVIGHDKKKVKEVFLRANRAIALVSFPMMLGLLVVAKPFILTLYGDPWKGVVPILQIFCITGIAQSLGTTVGWIYLSQGRTDLQFHWGIFAGIIRIAAIIVGIKWGIIGVAGALLLVTYVVLLYPGWTIPGRLIGLSFSEIVKNISGPFSCAVIMSAGVAACGTILPSDWPQWARLITQVPSGILSYGLLIHIFDIRAYREVRELALEQYRRLRPRLPVEVGTPL
jgi:PST family polysaccharide transporter